MWVCGYVCMCVWIPFTGGGEDFRPNGWVGFVRCHSGNLHQPISLRSVPPFPRYGGLEGASFPHRLSVLNCGRWRFRRLLCCVSPSRSFFVRFGIEEETTIRRWRPLAAAKVRFL